MTLVDQADGNGYIIVSAQDMTDPTTSYFSVYRRGAGNDFVEHRPDLQRNRLRRLRPHRRRHRDDG